MSTAPRSLFRIRYRTILLLLALGMILWSSVSYWREYSENSARRARELLAPPLGAKCSINLVGVEGRSVSGKIINQSDRWIVLEEHAASSDSNSAAKHIWIPREQIELIQIDPSR